MTMLKDNLNVRSALGALAGVALLSSPVVFASANHIDEARVISATPVYNDVRINRPKEECWHESVHEPVRNTRSNSATPELFGALLGAAVGYQFGGSKRSRHAAAATGAIIGTSVGNDWEKKQGRKTVSTKVTQVERCKTIDHYYTEQRLSGYEVAYRYNGDLYHTFTQRHPGDTLRVNVSVTPVE